jgi:hypothetical protein
MTTDLTRAILEGTLKPSPFHLAFRTEDDRGTYLSELYSLPLKNYVPLNQYTNM